MPWSRTRCSKTLMPPVVRREVNADPPSLSSITGLPCRASAVSISAQACSVVSAGTARVARISRE